MNRACALGLTLLAMLAMTALCGAGTASATRICKHVNIGEGDGKCNLGDREVEYDGAIATDDVFGASLFTNVATVVCSSTMTLDPASSTGSPISAEVTALALTGCKTNGGTKCTATVVNLPYPATVSTFTLLITDSSGAGFKLECGFLINCTFTTKEAELEVWPPTLVRFFANEVPMARSGGFCPETSSFQVEYEVNSPLAGISIE